MSGLARIPRRPKAPLLDGMARLVDLGTKLNRCKPFDSAVEADKFALQRDWEKIVNDGYIISLDAAIVTEKFVQEMENLLITKQNKD